MVSKYERMSVAIPINHHWDLDDIDKKAALVGVERSKFIMRAVDVFMDYTDAQLIMYFKGMAKIEEEERQRTIARLKKAIYDME